MDITIYSKDNCPNCLKAKNILKKYFPKIIMLGKDISREDFFLKFPSAKQVPQVVINGKHVGGFKEVEKWLAFNELSENF